MATERTERQRFQDAEDEIKVYHPYVKCCASGLDGEGAIIHPVIKIGQEARVSELPETLHGIRVQPRFEKYD